MERERLWTSIEAERRALADLLATLEPDQWDAPSLCRGWRVRDVAAHVTLATRARPLNALVGVVRARGNLNRYVAEDARARSSRPVDELIADLRAAAHVRRHPPGTRPEDPLVDVLVHAQDIARPLGVDHDTPLEAAVVAADRIWSMSFPFHARRRAAGVRLRATDATWARGDDAGDEAVGPLADILLVLAGRPAALAGLKGPGVDALTRSTPH